MTDEPTPLEPSVALAPKRSSRVRGYVFGALAVAFVFGALVHVTALVRATKDPDSPPWRHALFLAINLAAVAGFWRRPWYFLPAFTALALQQATTHGAHAVESAARGELAAPDIAVMAVFALGIAMLGWEAIETRGKLTESRRDYRRR